MNAKALHKFSYRMLKIRKALEGKKLDDVELHALFVLADKLWTDSYKLAEKRELEEARRKDNGEVLWTLIFPRDYGWEKQKIITRTPHRRIETCTFTGVHESATCPSNDPNGPFLELQKEWDRNPADYEKMRKRAELVASKPREFWASMGEAA